MQKKDFDLILGEEVEVNKPSYKGIQNWVNKREAHPYGHIDFITSGQMEIEIDGKSHIIHANQILCIPKNKPYTCYVKKSAYAYYSFYFSYTASKESTDFSFPLIFQPENVEYFKDKFKHAYDLSITQTYGYKIKIREIFYDVVSKINEEYFNKLGNDNGMYTIRKSIDFLNKNFDSPDISLLEISSISGISETHFRRIFKKAFGMPPTKYINNLRINKAKALLVNTNRSIEEIAYSCGYHEYSYFASVFSKLTGETPRAYRAKEASNALHLYSGE